MQSEAEQNYVVLARKWRPAQFRDIVGQQPVVRTLMNAIRAKRVHQAYLFTGSRGIGKTSIARIFAKAIRCENVSTESSGESAGGIDWLKSCDACASCREIAAGTSVDVMEIDGASNNGVDAVREIRESARYLPASGGRKIYIIDEVHMLTTQAFNALLKTLEEPPPHVIFVFATTEPHKIPATILSRCQRFDFRRVSAAQIHSRLQEVCKAEGFDAEPAALALIGRAAEGGMRDAMSLLDQVVSFAGGTGGKITSQVVRDSVGLIEGQLLLGILAAVFERKPLEALALLGQAFERGHDLRVLARGLIEATHGAVLARLGAPREAAAEFSEDEWAELQRFAPTRSLEEIELIFQVLHQGLDWIARSPQPRIVLDVLLAKCASAEALVYADSATAPSGAGSGLATAARPAPPAARTPTPVRASVSAPAVVAAPAPVAAPTPVVPTAAQLQPATQASSWEGFIAHVRRTKPLLASILEHGRCDGLVASGELVISYPTKDAYYREQLQSRSYAEPLSALAREHFGGQLRVKVELGDGGESVAARRTREHEERITQARSAAMNHPMIQEARSLFGGELGPIELTETENHAGG